METRKEPTACVPRVAATLRGANRALPPPFKIVGERSPRDDPALGCQEGGRAVTALGCCSGEAEVIVKAPTR